MERSVLVDEVKDGDRHVRNMSIMVKNDEVRRGLWDLSRAHRILELDGHNDMVWGHCSMRDSWGRGLWLKRGNIGMDEVFEEDFILIDFDGNVLSGDGVRHLEWPIHAEILRARPDLNFVAHTHAPWSTLFAACTGEVLQPITNDGAFFAVPPPHYMGTSDLIDTPALGKELAKAMGSAEAIFIRNHGPVLAGKTVKAMTLGALCLEKACKVQLQLAMSGLKYNRPDRNASDRELEKKHKSMWPPRALDNAWDYLNRKLDRVEGKTGVDKGECR
jgi:L-fuculose-phosphate aldolase